MQYFSKTKRRSLNGFMPFLIDTKAIYYIISQPSKSLRLAEIALITSLVEARHLAENLKQRADYYN
jgi:hypothetical protein